MPTHLANLSKVGLLGTGFATMLLVLSGGRLVAQGNEPQWSEQERPIYKSIGDLRAMPDDARAAKTKELALEIRALPTGQNRVILADGLASLSTEGDFGHDTLQEVATTLADALRDYPQRTKEGEIAAAYIETRLLDSLRTRESDPR